MEVVNAKCANCGAEIEIADNKATGFCPQCGSSYVKEDVVKNYNIHMTTVNEYSTTQNIVKNICGPQKKKRRIRCCKTVAIGFFRFLLCLVGIAFAAAAGIHICMAVLTFGRSAALWGAVGITVLWAVLSAGAFCLFDMINRNEGWKSWRKGCICTAVIIVGVVMLFMFIAATFFNFFGLLR